VYKFILDSPAKCAMLLNSKFHTPFGWIHFLMGYVSSQKSLQAAPDVYDADCCNAVRSVEKPSRESACTGLDACVSTSEYGRFFQEQL
jgi:hypothetical protein